MGSEAKTKEPNFVSKNDPSLALTPPPKKKLKLNRNTLRLGIIGFICLIVFGVIQIYLPERTKRNVREEESVKKIDHDLPTRLDIEESDYSQQFDKEAETQALVASQDDENFLESDRYASDDRRGDEEQVVAVRTGASGPTVFGDNTPLETDQENLEQEANESTIFFGSSVSIDGGDMVATSVASGKGQPQAVPLSEYEKLNQHAQKVAWLEAQEGDYSIYRDTLFTDQVAPGQELFAGTIIPIILITGINSDLPGEIKGQVLTDIYDSYTGTNLLIEGGSIVYGKYDSQISFGQNRVLFAWDRITRTDGVTITLGGMQGADRAGMSGVKDKVDYHYDSISAGVAIGSVFDLAVGLASAALNSLDIFNFGDEAENIFNDNATSAKNAVDNFVDNTFNRQPTLTVRPGFRTTMIVNRNIILPLYGW